ncbi:hypothetical protein T06_12087 [Trichinella sp. T6]|nr:hypothetical protein T06_12087 [Trichinella sp. T6]
MPPLSQLSSTVKQVNEDSTEQFITQLIINVEDHILLYHVNKLPMIQHIIQISKPEPSGQIKKEFAETCYSTAGLPCNMTGKDMVQAIQSDDFKFYESQVEIIKNCFTIQQPYHSDVSAVSSNHYSVGKRFSVEMLKVLEKQMLTSHMNNLLALPMFRDIFSILSPAVSGRLTNGCAKKIYSLLDFPFDIEGRITGPRGSTVKVIQTVCECRILLRWKEVNSLQIEVFVERDFESIVKFKLWRTFECINCMLKTFFSDEDTVNAIQLKDLKFYATQAEMLKVHFPINLSGVDSLNAPLYEKNSFITNILHLPPPVQNREIKKAFATKIYSTLHYPFDVAKRIMGSNSLTAKAIQNICECRIQVIHEKNNTIKVMVFPENDYDSILMFKVWKAFQCINCLLEIHPFDKDFVGEIQKADSQFWERQMEIIFNSLQIISSLPVSQYDATYTVSSENVKRSG